MVFLKNERGIASTISLGEVKVKYQNLFTQVKNRVGYGMAIKYLLADLNYLDDIADRICKQSGVNTVILGHSHDWELDKDTWCVKDRIYANSGTWCERDKPCTWVETEKLDGGVSTEIRVMDWNNGNPMLLKSASVDN